MSLLLRRRSGQPLELNDEALISHRTPPLPDKEPWIRGTGVHDFSAPRPPRTYSFSTTPTYPHSAGAEPSSGQLQVQGAEGTEGSTQPSEEQGGRVEREHTPVFKEHFDDDVDPAQRHSRVMAEALANQDFLARNTLQPPSREAALPLYAKPRKSPSQLAVPSPIEQQPLPAIPPSPITTKELPPLPTEAIIPERDTTALSPVLEDGAHEEEPTPRRRMPSQTSSRTRSRAFSGSEASLNGLPSHMNSRASRFSFQYGGSDSALQELMLEEKHKEKEAAKARAAAQVSLDERLAEEEDDMYGYDDMDGDEFGYSEEPIPGTEDDDDYFSGQRMQQEINGQGPASLYMQGNNVAGIGQMTLPQSLPEMDEEEDFEYGEQLVLGEASVSFEPPQAESRPTSGLGLVGIEADNRQAPIITKTAASSRNSDVPQAQAEISAVPADDELYFDDGLIDEANYQVGEFNEDIFDDPSHPFYERKPVDYEVSSKQQVVSEMTSPLAGAIADNTQPLAPQNSEPSFVTPPRNGELPFGDMDAYHKALAQAANKAAADGRFIHDEGLPQDSDEYETSEGPLSSHPSGIPLDSRVSQDTSFSTLGFGSGLPDDYEDSFDDFDCAIEDDPIIAAANAEVLANDYDGFYGQEFGFYAAAHGESEFTNGGYFGERGVDLNRKKSTREPNLTPITERSEYSHRNSFVSLHSRFGDAPALPSPGLAQLARMSPYGFDDDEMSFSQLRRLRKDTFGGSDGSARSGKSSPVHWTSSPTHSYSASRPTKQMYSVSVGSSPKQLPVGWNSGNESSENIVDEPLRQSQHENLSDQREPPDYSQLDESPVLGRFPHRQSLPSPLHPPSSFQLLQQQDQQSQQQQQLSPSFPFSDTTSTVSSNTTVTGAPESPMPWRKSHTRNSASADSVTYVKERQNDSGDYRWVLERRRTAESGELELIGREVVEGGRI